MGQTVAAPATALMKSRRRIASPQGSAQGIAAAQTARLEVDKTALGNVRFGSKADIVKIVRSTLAEARERLIAGFRRSPPIPVL
jgi:hypothetical protein